MERDLSKILKPGDKVYVKRSGGIYQNETAYTADIVASVSKARGDITLEYSQDKYDKWGSKKQARGHRFMSTTWYSLELPSPEIEADMQLQRARNQLKNAWTKEVVANLTFGQIYKILGILGETKE